MESNKPQLLTVEEYNKTVNETCDSIMSNVVQYLSNDVYVEKEDNFFIIKSFTDGSKKNEKEFSIKINKSEFFFNLYKKSSGIATHGFYTTSPSNNIKEKNYETGSFTVKISPDIFTKYEDWIIAKCNEFMVKKINSLKSNLYKDFKLDKVIKRKHITNTIINEKEDL